MAKIMFIVSRNKIDIINTNSVAKTIPNVFSIYMTHEQQKTCLSWKLLMGRISMKYSHSTRGAKRLWTK